MLKRFLLVFSILTLNFGVFSQGKSDLELRHINGKVHQINYYDSFGLPGPDWRESASTSGRLSAIYVYNRRGNPSVEVNYSGDLKECSFTKTVYSYDRKNRKKTAAVYKSARTVAFCDATAPIFEENQTAYLDDKTSFVELTKYYYDRKGRIKRETVFDRDKIIIEDNIFEYNARGENTKLTRNWYRNPFPDAPGEPLKTAESRTVFRDGGKTLDDYYYENGKPTINSIHYFDERYRQVKIEQYRLETDAGNNIIKRTLKSCSKKYYDGVRTITEWTHYDPAGNLIGWLYSLSENDNELMQLQYSPRNSAAAGQIESVRQGFTHYRFDPAADTEIDQRLKYLLKFDRAAENSNWVPTGFRAVFYKFDEQRNVIQRSTLQKKSPAEENPIRSFSRQDIIYYQ